MTWRAHQEQVSERICEQIVDVQMVEQLVKLLNTESQDRIQRFENKTVEVRQSQIVEKIDETPEIPKVQEHAAVLAQLALRISGIMMKFGAVTGEDPFARVKGLITESTNQLQKEAFEDGTAKHSSTLETAVSRSTPESVNEGHPDEICEQTSDVVIDACLTCDAKYKIACETCVKDNTVMVEREITVIEKHEDETLAVSLALLKPLRCLSFRRKKRHNRFRTRTFSTSSTQLKRSSSTIQLRSLLWLRDRSLLTKLFNKP